jgi:periplasmic copper chaperone A
MRFLLIPAIVLLAAAGDASTVKVDHPWARATPGNATSGAAYVTLTETGAADTLTGASTPAASTAELHETISDNGVMKMRPVGPVALTPGQAVKMAPGGMHIMLMGLKAPLKAGATFPLTLTFAHGAPVTVTVAVEAAGATMPNMPTMPSMSGMGNMMGGHTH